jgi:hypothetical protein
MVIGDLFKAVCVREDLKGFELIFLAVYLVRKFWG